MDPQTLKQLQELGPMLIGLGQTLTVVNTYTYEQLTQIRDVFAKACETVQDVRDETFSMN